ncbi:AGE family epimerase/isomerase [Paenibacillus sp. LHD-117]|uniref:AGE family epimerase/isomerase n=1 Tax=Paenibacillus sp. LHD-117 TaxID=3071412 RepID=UPI0027E0CC31|nr:AGE family epimerase/isomerase [Paenibacillus sp. LHD-117]MDQ6421212.1 AGE family epimerase/isomerase [Paenibacillus sp. LHD-117]
MEIDMKAWRAAIDSELRGNILDFWMKHAPDEHTGGFHGYVSRELEVQADADRSLVLNTRILWTFSAAYRIYGDQQYLDMARRAYDYVRRYFADREYGGLYWSVTSDGKTSSDKKQVYGQAFAIYAFSEYGRATGDEEALNEAIELYRVLERHAYDPVNRGYVEALARDWTETDDNSLSSKDLNTKKSMNTHLHVLEAYTNLYRVWPSEELRGKLKELVEVTIRHIVDPVTAHFLLFFDMEWNSQSNHISYGHDIEGSWLLHEAAEALGDSELLAEAKSVAVRMAEATYLEGVDADGGLFNEAGPEGLTDDAKDWWPQAEAVVGFYNAYQLTDEARYRDAALASWHFIETYLVDRKFGEWFWSVTRDGNPSDNPQKISAWKCPYHNGRACFELLERLEAAEEATQTI